MPKSQEQKNLQNVSNWLFLLTIVLLLTPLLIAVVLYVLPIDATIPTSWYYVAYLSVSLVVPLVVMVVLVHFLLVIKQKLDLLVIGKEVLLIVFVSIFIWIFYFPHGGPPPPSQCTFPAGITCTTTKLHAVTGQLTLEIGQGTGYTMRVTGVTCTQNTSQEYATSGSIIYDPPTNVTIASGSKKFIADGRETASGGIANVICTDADGNLPNDASVGTQYNGRVYMNYTETDTGIERITVGILSQRFEA